MKNHEQIAAEIAALNELKPLVRHYSLFGDDHWRAIDAQVETLEKKLTVGDAYRVFAQDADNVQDYAAEAAAWWTEDPREDFPVSLVDEWQSLVVKQ